MTNHWIINLIRGLERFSFTQSAEWVEHGRLGCVEIIAEWSLYLSTSAESERCQAGLTRRAPTRAMNTSMCITTLHLGLGTLKPPLRSRIPFITNGTEIKVQDEGCRVEESGLILYLTIKRSCKALEDPYQRRGIWFIHCFKAVGLNAQVFYLCAPRVCLRALLWTFDSFTVHQFLSCSLIMVINEHVCFFRLLNYSGDLSKKKEKKNIVHQGTVDSDYSTSTQQVLGDMVWSSSDAGGCEKRA